MLPKMEKKSWFKLNQARFDETNNITYAEQMQAAGVELIFGIPGLKVHSKICIIEKKD